MVLRAWSLGHGRSADTEAGSSSVEPSPGQGRGGAARLEQARRPETRRPEGSVSYQRLKRHVAPRNAKSRLRGPRTGDVVVGALATPTRSLGSGFGSCRVPTGRLVRQLVSRRELAVVVGRSLCADKSRRGSPGKRAMRGSMELLRPATVQCIPTAYCRTKTRSRGYVTPETALSSHFDVSPQGPLKWMRPWRRTSSTTTSSRSTTLRSSMRRWATWGCTRATNVSLRSRGPSMLWNVSQRHSAHAPAQNNA